MSKTLQGHRTRLNKQKQKGQKHRQSVVTCWEQLYCAVQSQSPDYCQMTTGKKVFSSWLNIVSDNAFLTDDGKLFHARAKATAKAWSPSVEPLNVWWTGQWLRWSLVMHSQVMIMVILVHSAASVATYFKLSWHFLKFPEKRRWNIFHVTGLNIDETTAFPCVPMVLPLLGHHPHQLNMLHLLNSHIHTHTCSHRHRQTSITSCTHTYTQTYMQPQTQTNEHLL